jgi:acyl-CoA reductase-like NAD-dependent aldehyde dehydrogenase
LHGPQITARQRDLVVRQIERAELEGAKVAARGSKPDGPGFWVEPTLLTQVAPDSKTAQEEIFGPVLAVMPYDDDDDAVRIANNSSYGLAAGVWSADEARAEAIARRLRVGAVSINTSMFIHPSWPFGGMKQSGIGRESGIEGFNEYLETKTITFPDG